MKVEERPRGKSSDHPQRKPTTAYEDAAFNNQLSRLIHNLDQGLADQTQLLKMLVIKNENADTNFNRLRSSINNGQADQIDR